MTATPDARDRLAKGYVPDFDLDVAVGQQGELYVADIAQMLANGSGEIEVKTDQRIASTGRVYIEYECMRRGKWQRSGILATSALVWAFVLPANVLIAAPVTSVRELAHRYWRQYGRECARGSHPTRGVAIPVGLFTQELYKFEVRQERAS